MKLVKYLLLMMSLLFLILHVGAQTQELSNDPKTSLIGTVYDRHNKGFLDLVSGEIPIFCDVRGTHEIDLPTCGGGIHDLPGISCCAPEFSPVCTVEVLNNPDLYYSVVGGHESFLNEGVLWSLTSLIPDYDCGFPKPLTKDDRIEGKNVAWENWNFTSKTRTDSWEGTREWIYQGSSNNCNGDACRLSGPLGTGESFSSTIPFSISHFLPRSKGLGHYCDYNNGCEANSYTGEKVESGGVPSIHYLQDENNKEQCVAACEGDTIKPVEYTLEGDASVYRNSFSGKEVSYNYEIKSFCSEDGSTLILTQFKELDKNLWQPQNMKTAPVFEKIDYFEKSLCGVGKICAPPECYENCVPPQGRDPFTTPIEEWTCFNVCDSAYCGDPGTASLDLNTYVGLSGGVAEANCDFNFTSLPKNGEVVYLNYSFGFADETEDNIIVVTDSSKNLSLKIELNDKSGSVVCSYTLSSKAVLIDQTTGKSQIEENIFETGERLIADLDEDNSLTYNQQISLEKYIIKNIEPFTPHPWFDLLTEEYDCDDWKIDDDEICGNLNKFANEYLGNCFEDMDNDGIGDYASCSYCRFPGQNEFADDIDNDCQGHFQSTGNECNLYIEQGGLGVDFVGDGRNSVDFVDFDSKEELLLSPFLARDNFCQMVDDQIVVNGEVCGGYDRVVKWIEYKEPEGLSFPLQNVHLEVSYQPGGVDGNVDCSVKRLVKNEETFLLQEESSKFFNAISEDQGLRRNTNNLESQHIDSIRGECNFDAFWNELENPSTFNGLKNFHYVVDGVLDKSRFDWQTECVVRDKCSDGVDNEGVENLFEEEPYKSFLPYLQNIESNTYNIDLEFSSNGFYLPINFVDIDDSECKFSDLGPKKLREDPVVYDIDKKYYKERPYSIGINYCLDDDGDGFCGCRTMEVEDVGNLDNCKRKEKIEVPTGPDIVNCLEWGKKKICRQDQASLLSKQFPDCDDTIEEGEYTIDLKNDGNEVEFFAEYAFGWPFSKIKSEKFTARHVHPLAPVTPLACNIGKYDFNCNLNDNAGWAFHTLKDGGTPFDYDISTGKELFHFTQIHNNFDNDAVCYQKAHWRDLYITTAAGLGLSALSLTGIGALAGVGGYTVIAGAATKTATLIGAVLIPLDVWEIGVFGNSIVELSGGKSWDSVKGPITDSVFTVIGHGAAYSLNSIVKARLENLEDGKKLIVTSRKKVKDVTKTSADIAQKGVPGCFLDDTGVLMANGDYKNIIEVQVGDEVVAYDLENKRAVNATVSHTFNRQETKYRIIEYEIIK